MAVTRRTVVFLLPLVAASAAGGQKKSERLKPGIAEVVEISVRRPAEEHIISIDGRIRNAGERPIKGLTLVFSIIAPGGEEVSRQRGAIEDDPLEPGEESEFHWQLNDHARAVEVRVAAANHDGFQVGVVKPGPYAIE